MLKRFFLAINIMIASTALANPNALLHKMQQAHIDVVSCYSTITKNAIISTVLSGKKAMIVGCAIGAYAGTMTGALLGDTFFNWQDDSAYSENLSDRIIIGMIKAVAPVVGGTIIGVFAGAISGFVGTPFYYTFWKKYFERQITEKFFNVLESTSPELRQETSDYLKTQPEQAVAEKYFAGDIKALAIFKALLADSLA
jgi:hypothetical protein